MSRLASAIVVCTALWGLACPLVRDDPHDQKRCVPACGAEETCHEAQCVAQGDAGSDGDGFLADQGDAGSDGDGFLADQGDAGSDGDGFLADQGDAGSDGDGVPADQGDGPMPVDVSLDQAPDQHADAFSGIQVSGTLSLASSVVCGTSQADDCKGGIAVFAFPCADTNCQPVDQQIIVPADLSGAGGVTYQLSNILPVGGPVAIAAYLLENEFTESRVKNVDPDSGDLWATSGAVMITLVPGNTHIEDLQLTRIP